MTPIQALHRLFSAIKEEVDRNPSFERSVSAALGLEEVPRNELAGVPPAERRTTATRGNRRPPGPFDPFSVYFDEGEETLRERLAGLTVEELKNIVSEHGMDTAKLALKWRSTQRLIDLVMDRVLERSTKGDAFR